MADLIAQCMDPDPGGRPSAREVAAVLSQPDSMLDRRLPPRREPSGSGSEEVRGAPAPPACLHGLLPGHARSTECGPAALQPPLHLRPCMPCWRSLPGSCVHAAVRPDGRPGRQRCAPGRGRAWSAACAPWCKPPASLRKPCTAGRTAWSLPDTSPPRLMRSGAPCAVPLLPGQRLQHAVVAGRQWLLTGLPARFPSGRMPAGVAIQFCCSCQGLLMSG